MTVKKFLELRAFLTVAHHIPGRLRLKLDPGIRQHPAAPFLERLSQQSSENGIVSARLNPIARSLVLEYDVSRVSSEALQTFLTSQDPEEARLSAEAIADVFGLTLSTLQGEIS